MVRGDSGLGRRAPVECVPARDLGDIGDTTNARKSVDSRGISYYGPDGSKSGLGLAGGSAVGQRKVG